VSELEGAAGHRLTRRYFERSRYARIPRAGCSRGSRGSFAIAPADPVEGDCLHVGDGSEWAEPEMRVLRDRFVLEQPHYGPSGRVIGVADAPNRGSIRVEEPQLSTFRPAHVTNLCDAVQRAIAAHMSCESRFCSFTLPLRSFHGQHSTDGAHPCQDDRPSTSFADLSRRARARGPCC
jgi:hypothetical protein